MNREYFRQYISLVIHFVKTTATSAGLWVRHCFNPASRSETLSAQSSFVWASHRASAAELKSWKTTIVREFKAGSPHQPQRERLRTSYKSRVALFGLLAVHLLLN